jgi:hypothetical protein
MIGVIPNPKKTITIDFPIEQVKVGARNIDKVMKFCHFREENDMFNSYKFSRSELLSMGSFININLNSIGETKTQIDIEISRQLGAFDEWVEIQKANTHIEDVMNSIAFIIKNGIPTSKPKSPTSEPPKRILNLKGKILSFVLWLFIGMVIGQISNRMELNTMFNFFLIFWFLGGWMIPVTMISSIQTFTKPNPNLKK